MKISTFVPMNATARITVTYHVYSPRWGIHHYNTTDCPTWNAESLLIISLIY